MCIEKKGYQSGGDLSGVARVLFYGQCNSKDAAHTRECVFAAFLYLLSRISLRQWKETKNDAGVAIEHPEIFNNKLVNWDADEIINGFWEIVL